MTTEINVEQADDEGLYDLVDELTEEGNEITQGKVARVKRWFVKSRNCTTYRVYNHQIIDLCSNLSIKRK